MCDATSNEWRLATKLYRSSVNFVSFIQVMKYPMISNVSIIQHYKNSTRKQKEKHTCNEVLHKPYLNNKLLLDTNQTKSLNAMK